MGFGKLGLFDIFSSLVARAAYSVQRDEDGDDTYGTSLGLGCHFKGLQVYSYKSEIRSSKSSTVPGTDMERPLSSHNIQLFLFFATFFIRHFKMQAASTMNQSDIRGLSHTSGQSRH